MRKYFETWDKAFVTEVVKDVPVDYVTQMETQFWSRQQTRNPICQGFFNNDLGGHNLMNQTITGKEMRYR